MKAKSEYPTRHGDQHAPDGSDPIPSSGSGLQFNAGTYGADNEGDWFFGAANDATGSPNGYSWQFDTGTSSAAFAITGDGGFRVDTAGQIVLLATSGLNMEYGGGNWINDGGLSETINSDYILDVGGGVGGPYVYQVTVAGEWSVTSGDKTVLTVGTSPFKVVVAGKVFEFRGDGNFHIPTGASVIADT